MLGRQPVLITYAHKRRRVQNASKKLPSSPLEVLPPDMDDLTRTQMAHRMLKRSRRVALSEQLEDKNVEHIREHLAKRIKRTQERVSDLEPTEVSSDVAPQDDVTLQTPFPSSQSVHGSAINKPPVSEQMSPVPVAKRVVSRTSSRSLKENSTHSQVLASPFSSRPGSAATSPKHKSRRRSSRQVSRIFLHAKSRALSGVFKENSRRLSRKDSTASLKTSNRESFARHIKHQRYPSTPTSYMRSQFLQEDWNAPPKALSRTFDGYDEIPSPSGSVHSNSSFYADQPRFCSTPAISRLRKVPDLHGLHTKNDNFRASFSPPNDSPDTDSPDVGMMDGTVPACRQTIHLSGNSIFSSSDEFTIRSLPAMHDTAMDAERRNVSGRDEAPPRSACQVLVHRELVDGSQVGHSLTGSFVAEYDIPLPDLDHFPASTVVTKTLDPKGAPKLSVGDRLFGLPGTSPVHGGNLFTRSSTNPGVHKSSVGEQLFGLPGTSPARGETFIFRTSRNPGTLTPPASPYKTDAPCPPSPASDLALELQSMDICGDPDTRSDGEVHRPSATIPLQTRSHSLQDAPVEPSTKESIKRRPARNRASTIRASDFSKPGALSSGVASGLTVPPLSNVRRTRSGTVVGLDSKLATKGAGLPTQSAKGAPATRLAAVQSGSESESDDELLLKSFWMEDMEYLGLAVPPGRKDVEADEMNLGGLWHGLESGPSRRLGLRRR